MRIIVGLLILMAFASACSKDSVPEDVQINDFLEENSYTDYIEDLGMIIVIHEEGEGTAMPNQNSNVRVSYVGYKMNGDVFDSNSDVVFKLSNLIAGWRIGIPYLKKNGSATFVIPSNLAYGSASPSNGNPIVFEMTLLDF